MTPFLSLDGLSAVDASGGSSATSPLADGELGKAFLQQFSEHNSEGAEQGDSSDQALTVTIDPKGANGSPIVYLNLETGIDPETLANVEVEITDAEGLDADDLQAANESALAAIAAEGDSETPQDTDSDLEAKLRSDSDENGLVNTESPTIFVTAPAPEENSEEISDAEATITMISGTQGVAENANSDLNAKMVAARPVEQSISAVPVETVVPKAEKAIAPADDLDAVKLSLTSDSVTDVDLETDSLQQAVQNAPKVGLSTNAVQAQNDESPDLPPAEPAISQSASMVSTASAQTFGLGATTELSGTVSDSPASLTSGVSAVAATVPPSSAPVAQPVVAPAQTPAHYVAVPADIASIISQELSSDRQTNHVRVQLDPPELGRVSLEFKFDSHGLQHVVITADSADAIRRIRAFHPDLVSVLDEHGLSSQDMTFREQASGQNPAQDWTGADITPVEDEADMMAETPAPLPRTPQPRSASAGLDIRV
ncbi:flagellar hook-length control protein FliK [Hyphomonas sp.]|uniref:flagellar hook-length control protein FliK n=1 Tax=Hyphomonas sp. TaxID=87 RepID=UPI003002FEA0